MHILFNEVPDSAAGTSPGILTTPGLGRWYSRPWGLFCGHRSIWIGVPFDCSLLANENENRFALFP